MLQSSRGNICEGVIAKWSSSPTCSTIWGCPEKPEVNSEPCENL